MSKLLHLKNFFTIEEAIKHLSTMLGEEVNQEDIYHMASQDIIRLSLYFPEPVLAKRISISSLHKARVAIKKEHTFKGNTARYIVKGHDDLSGSTRSSIRKFLEDKKLSDKDIKSLDRLFKQYPKVIENGERTTDGHYVGYEGDDGIGDDEVIEYFHNEYIHVDGLWDIVPVWSSDIAYKKRLEKPFWSPKINKASFHGFLLTRENTNTALGEPKLIGIHIDRFENMPGDLCLSNSGGYPPIDLFPYEALLVIKTEEIIRMINLSDQSEKSINSFDSDITKLKKNKAEKKLNSRAENNYLKTIHVLSECLIGSLTSQHKSNAQALEAIVAEKGLKLPVETQALTAYLKKSSLTD